MSFEHPEVVTPLETEPYDDSQVDKHAEAVMTAHGEDYTSLQKELGESNQLPGQILLTKQKFRYDLEQATWMTERDWKMLAIMNYRDASTAKHCVQTFLLAKKKLETCKLGDRTLKDLVESEVGNIDAFYRACLFHDVGKCCLPQEVLNNKLTDKELAAKLCESMSNSRDASILTTIEKDLQAEYIGMRDENGFPEFNDDLLAFVSKAHPVRYATLSIIFSPVQIAVLKKRFPNITESSTLADVIRFHEQESVKILKAEGYDVEAEIAGGHHNYDGHILRYKLASALLGVSAKVEEILALADIQEALTAERIYKSKFTIVKALDCLIQEVKLRQIDGVLAAIWVRSELELITPESLSKEDALLLPYVEKFVKETLINI